METTIMGYIGTTIRIPSSQNPILWGNYAGTSMHYLLAPSKPVSGSERGTSFQGPAFWLLLYM